MDYLLSVRHKYGIARTEIESLLPLINAMHNNSIENQNYELFIEAVENAKIGKLSVSHSSIQDVVIDANLYLTDDERKRFYKMCVNDYKILFDTFNQICEATTTLSKARLKALRQVYFENEFIGHCYMPTYDMCNEEQDIQKEIINGISMTFKDFRTELDKIDINTSETASKTKEFNITSERLEEATKKLNILNKPQIEKSFEAKRKIILQDMHNSLIEYIKENDIVFRCNHSMSRAQLRCLFELLKANSYIADECDADTCALMFLANDLASDISNKFFDAHKEEFSINQYYLDSSDNEQMFLDYIEEYLESNKIIWIKINEQKKNDQINKRAILDLLKQLGSSAGDIKTIKTLHQISIDECNTSVLFSRQNRLGFENANYKSEYYDDIEKLITEAKQVK